MVVFMKGMDKKEILLWVFIAILILLRLFDARRSFENGQVVVLKGIIHSEPIQYEYSRRVVLHGFKIYLDPVPKVEYGDYIEVSGVVEDDKLENAVLIDLEETKNPIYQLRAKLFRFYKSALPEPDSSLVAGMVLGAKAGMSQDFWEALKLSGTVHVVVASGMNVTLVAGFLMAVLILVIPRRKAVLFAIIGVWIYAMLSGFDAPIVRAAVMGTIGFSAIFLGRINYAYRALFLSAGIMLIFYPLWIYDLGFILSFSATLSLMLFERRINKWSRVIPGIFREGFSTSVAAQILVAPILVFAFGSVNVLSPVINALILWTVPIVTVVGMISGIASLLAYEPARLILLLDYPLTRWFIFVVEVFS